MQSAYASCSWVPTQACVKLPRNSEARLKTKTHYCYLDNSGEDGGDNSGEAQVKSITSTSNPFVKHCLKLHQSSSYRHSHASVLVVGSTPIREIFISQESLQERSVELEYLLVLDKTEVSALLGNNSSSRVVRVSSVVMKKLSQANIVDDGQQGGVFLLPGCCDPFNSKALRASRGASFQIPIVSGSWYHLEALKDEYQMKMLAGHPDCDDKLKPVSQLSQGFADCFADVPLCLVLGSEGHGLSEKAQQECELLSIPMAGEFESLNVAVAGESKLH
ncbi:unnamed protein product [Dovyalis caffra]|uniref:tRNA/rRNA methyltransferase SpoU type domain-containing protein n=1 Tax=Dovyalis caffra TaxID=77055 RepID=A0AAV1RSF9_9ROSI|nr:unnamed protein product [Dovyalis caffra]